MLRIFAASHCLLVTSALLLIYCSGSPPASIGVTGKSLAPCPTSPNCVSSDATDAEHKAEPFMLATTPDKTWMIVKEEVRRLPRTKIIKETGSYIHAECRSAVWRFVDDLELLLRPADNMIAFRSASRLGYSDFGVNRSRIEALRVSLKNRGAVQ